MIEGMQAAKVIHAWEEFASVGQQFLNPISSNTEFEAAETLLDEISDRMDSASDPRYIGLFRILAERIKAWEDQQEPIPDAPAHQVLSFLMEQHQLRQIDLKEFVDQSTLSKILRGEREISKRLAKNLAAHFHAPIELFLS